MRALKHILVVVDNHEANPALLKAEWLAKRTGAELHLLKVVYHRFASVKRILGSDAIEKLRDELMTQAESQLSELVTGLGQNGITAHKQVLWHPHPAEAICKCAKYGEVDLIIKAVEPHHRWGHLMTTTTEWDLIRHSAVPVLFVKDSRLYDKQPIVVAVDVGSEDDAHRALNAQLLREAEQWQKFTGAPVHVVTAYPLPSMDVPAEFSVVNYEALRDEIEQGYRRAASELVEKFSLEVAKIWVEEGLTEEILANVVEKTNAVLVLAGTVARTGISAVVVGNTAERIIDAVDCDVMTLRRGSGVEFVQDE